MNWNKLKTFLIVLFSAINIFLIITMVTKDYKETVVPEVTIQDTVEILAKNGITIDKKLIPDSAKGMESFSMKTMNISGLGAVVDPDKKTFSFTASSEVEDLDDLEDFLEDKGIQYAEFVSKPNKLSSVSAVEKIDGYSIFGSYLDVSVSGSSISVKGQWLLPSSEPQKSDDTNPIQVTSILIDYISNPDRPQDAHKITAIDFGYHVPEYELTETVQKVTAVPSWRITTDNGMQLYYDARNGEYLK